MANNPSTLHRFSILVALYVTQAVPLGFFIVAMPAILRREGLGLSSVGLLSALALPWLIKFLWAPLVDRYGSARGHFRSWILPLQIGSIVSLIAISQIDLRTSPISWLVVIGAVFMMSSASQDIATDGLAVRVLAPSERGIGNGIQVGGYYLGQIAGGGLVLVLYGLVGWQVAVLSMAGLLALTLLPVFTFREPAKPSDARREKIGLRTLGAFLRRPGGRLWALILVTFRAGEGMAITMLNPMLVDKGLKLESIGLTLGVVGSVASLAGALAGGWFVTRLGRKTSLLVFGAGQALALLGYLVLARCSGELAAVLLVVAIAAFASGLATTALYTNMMDRCDQRTAATDFTLQQSLAAAGPMLGAMTSGFIAAAIGYELHFAFSAALVVVAVGLVGVLLTPELAAASPADDARLAPSS